MKRTMVLTAVALLVVMLPALAMAGKDVRKVEKSFELKKGGNLEIDIDLGGDITIETSGAALSFFDVNHYVVHDPGNGLRYGVAASRAHIWEVAGTQEMSMGVDSLAFGPSGGTVGQLGWSGTELLIKGGATEAIAIGSSGELGFFQANPIAKPAVAGSWGGNVAGANLAAALATLGLITDNTT